MKLKQLQADIHKKDAKLYGNIFAPKTKVILVFRLDKSFMFVHVKFVLP